MIPEPNRKLYKFSGPTEYALQNLENGVIFCQHYTAYNDPFEFWSNIQEGIPDAKQEPDRFLAAKKAWGAEFWADDDEYLIEYFTSCEDLQPSFQRWIQNSRIVCFGTEPDNLLMWSHYGDGLRGFCLAFSEDQLLQRDGNGFLADVTYTDKPPIADAFVWAVVDYLIEYNEMELEEISGKSDKLSSEGLSESDIRNELERAYKVRADIIKGLFATKPIEWIYERERRLLFQAKIRGERPTLEKYPAIAITGVLIGEIMPASYRERLETVVTQRYSHASVCTVKRSKDSYALIIE